MAEAESSSDGRTRGGEGRGGEQSGGKGDGRRLRLGRRMLICEVLACRLRGFRRATPPLLAATRSYSNPCRLHWTKNVDLFSVKVCLAKMTVHPSAGGNGALQCLVPSSLRLTRFCTKPTRLWVLPLLPSSLSLCLSFFTPPVCLSACLSGLDPLSRSRSGADRLLIAPVVRYPWQPCWRHGAGELFLNSAL